MKRQVTFDFENGQYVLKEHGRTIFHIDGKELKFISLDFYNGVYKDKTAAIELINKIGNDDFKKGRYIFEWLTDIVTSIQKELNDPELNENTDNQYIFLKCQHAQGVDFTVMDRAGLKRRLTLHTQMQTTL